jgi:hypothetical protein
MRHAKLFSVSEERMFRNEWKSVSGVDVCRTDYSYRALRAAARMFVLLSHKNTFHFQPYGKVDLNCLYSEY